MSAAVSGRLLAILLALTMLLSCCPIDVFSSEAPSAPVEPSQAATDPSEGPLPEDPPSEETPSDPPQSDTDEPDADQPDIDQPDSDQPDTDQPDTDQPETDQPDIDQPDTDQPDTDQPDTDQPDTDQPETDQPDTDQPDTDQPDTDQPDTDQPDTDQPDTDQPDTDQPDTDQPDTDQPDADQTKDVPLQNTLSVQEDADISGPGLYFGLLRAHSGISTGTADIEDLFSSAAQIPGMDFFAVTDHSDSFDNHLTGAIGTDGATISTDWAAGKSAAAAVTTNSFVGLYGYEMNWPARMQIGHITTFCTPGFQSPKQDAYQKYNGALQNYYSALSTVPNSISQFNHPGTQYGSFSNFEYSEAADRAVSLLELGDDMNCRYYNAALDRGWHLSPTADPDCGASARTVVYAQSLTEDGIYDALRNGRTYATEDPDLEILYTMNGHFMGSRLKRRHVGDSLQISVSLHDPSDSAIGLVEVISSGKTVDDETFASTSGTLNFSLPVNSGYYYLQITQPDGDRAVTAPIWLDAEEQLGISGVTCETAIPIQNEETLLNLELYNGETVDFDVSSLEVLADGIPVSVASDLTKIPAGSNLTHPLSITADCMGLTDLALRLTGMLEGSSRTYETALTVNFHRAEQVTSILMDGSHGNADLDQLTTLQKMAMNKQIQMTVAESRLTPEMLKDCRFLLISPPSAPFSDAFLEAVSAFAGYGGSIIVCGQGNSQGNGFSSATELNRLLSSIGSTMQLKEDLVEDTTTNGGTPHLLFLDKINMGTSWCDNISKNQVYRFSSGCSVDPGMGTWLVKGRSTTGDGNVTTLACEALSGGGTVFVSGSFFLTDTDLAEPKNIFDEPYANRTLAQTLLGIGGEALPLSTIAQARAAAPGTLVRVRGYATTGTSNPYNSFPNMIYLQDDTGGIVITPFEMENIQQGTPLEVVGFVGPQTANKALKISTVTILDADPYQYLPMTGSWKSLLDPASNGQRLIQVEGKCLEIYCREDDTLAGCLLEDDGGNRIRVKIEDHIRNGSDEENELHKKIRKGRTVRAMGLLHVDEYGETVIRVRNCEEVVWVPPRHYWNPKTGDNLPVMISSCLISLTGLLLLRKRKSA